MIPLNLVFRGAVSFINDENEPVAYSGQFEAKTSLSPEEAYNLVDYLQNELMKLTKEMV